MEGNSVSDQHWLVLRTQEIIAQSKEIGGRDAVKIALRERFGQNFDQLLDFTAGLTGVLKKLSKATYELPDQPTLMDIPQTIVINTDEGPLFMDRQQAQLGHVRQWVSEGLQHHSAQKYRFGRLAKDLKSLDSQPDEIAWVDVRYELAVGDDAE
jgi:hypothetical protein